MTAAARCARQGLAAFAAVVLLAGCNGEAQSGSEAAGEVSDETLAAVVADADGYSVATETMRDAGLAQVFDGAAAYTILVPSDAVFEELGETGEALRSAEQRPAMVAILRDHIVPGFLTPEDIERAIELDEDGSVKMQTMNDHTLTFTREGDAIAVANEDGATARITGEAMRASNGVAIPLDGLLKNIAPPQG